MEPDKVNSSLKQTILNRIENEQVCPHSTWFYSGRECFVWSLWLFTVLLGATAVAVSLSVALYQQHSFFEITHGSFFWFMLEVLPFLWFLVFTAMSVLAVFNLRHTKHGYRYPMWQILGSSVAVSLVGGVGLHLIGFGFMLDEQIGRKVKVYESQIKMEQKMWQAPEAGRLVGAVMPETTEEKLSDDLNFMDINGFAWVIDETELKPEEIDLLKGGNRVRLLGQIMADKPTIFHVCGVLPWVYEKRYSANELELFKSNMRNRIQEFEQPMLGSGDVVTSSGGSICASAPFVQQMRRREERRY